MLNEEQNTGEIKMEQIIEAKRELGDGRWDKILKRKMVELSSQPTYALAKNEWEATGRVYHHQYRGNEPDWVDNVGFCLCGHRIVYHFEIRNTVTGATGIVGSDHIGAYLIIRQMVTEFGYAIEDITNSMIEDWLKVRVQSMKSDAWWLEHGEHFTEMFEEIKELDVAINCKGKEYHLNSDTYTYSYAPKTRAKGKFGDYGYQMASIVWRWNNEDNGKNQLLKYGYPNDRLWADLNLFYALRSINQPKLDNDIAVMARYTANHREAIVEEKRRAVRYRAKREEERIAWEAGADERKRLEVLAIHQRVVENQRREEELVKRKKEQRKTAIEILSTTSEVFNNMCDYYGIAPFEYNETYTTAQLISLATTKEMIERGNDLQPYHLNNLKETMGGI
tara:strand:- start:218 stop:1396 length:1179 start_codon:yes stop_codon:yes gene_type:complete